MSVGHDDTVAGSLPSAGPGDAEIPELVAGRYRIVRWLGAGGMGRVYEAEDTELGERIALKVLRSGIAGDALERFRREVRLTRKIQHRNIARMFDIGDHRGEKFLTMELVAGAPLTQAGVTKFEWPRLQKVAVQICEGLAAAHLAGVVHRDLKPDNVLLERESDRVVITDFGIARSGNDETVTQVGALVGTPRYMAPEQLAGLEVDARADLFSLGMMLYELATGTRPWTGDTAVALAVAQATQAPRPFSGARVPAAFAAIVMELLALDREQRPANAVGLGERIAAVRAAAAELGGAALGLTPTLTPIPTGVPGLSLPGGGTGPTTIAVLNIVTAPVDAYLAETLREELVDALSAGTLRVRPTTAAALDPGADALLAGRQLGVDHVVIGSIRRSGAALRIAVRLVGIADGFQIWAKRIELPEGELLAASDELAREIAAALSTRAASPSAKPTDPRAVELYLKARSEMRRFWGAHALTAVDLLQQADAIAPDTATIIGQLAYARVQAWLKLGEPHLLAPAREIAARALALGEPEGSLAAGLLRINLGEVEAGAAEIATALARAPMNSAANETAARLLADIGLADDARRLFALAIALDPGRENPIQFDLVRMDALDGDYASVEARHARLATDPDQAVVEAGALSQARIAIWLRDFTTAIEVAGRFAARVGPIGSMLAAITRRWLDTQTFDAVMWDATIAVPLTPDRPQRMQATVLQRATEMALALEQPEAALQALDRANELKLLDIVWLDRMPLLASLRTDPRFIAIRSDVEARAARVMTALRVAL